MYTSMCYLERQKLQRYSIQLANFYISFQKLVTTNNITIALLLQSLLFAFNYLTFFGMLYGELCDKYIIPPHPSKYNREFRHAGHRYKLQHTISR